MKRSGMPARSEPMRRGTGPRRATPLPHTRPLAVDATQAPLRAAQGRRKPPRYTGPPEETVTALILRDRGVCVICGRPGTDWDPLVPHHRKNRGMGGSSNPAINRTSNLLLIHRSENAALEQATRPDFYDRGWKLKDVSAALGTPVLYPDGRWYRLDDEGGRREVAAPMADA